MAFEEGLTVKTIWEHGDNADLRKERESPHLLVPGDKVVVPDLRVEPKEGAHEKRHRFRRKTVPEKLRLQLLSFNEPRANLEYRLDVGTEVLEGKTDGDGFLEADVAPDLGKARLFIGDEEEYEIVLRNLRPADLEEGVRQRLSNLGFLEDEDAEEEELRAAVARFQSTQGKLVPNGEVDDDTRDALEEMHGS